MANTQHATPVAFTVDAAGVSMSGLVAHADQCRAVIVALHGGASNSSYWDAPGHPRHSLLRTGPALGFTVIAPDRPGYGASRPHVGEHLSPGEQVDLVSAVLEEVLADSGRGAGLFLVGHSQGCVMAIRMASDPRFDDLLGIEISGTGVEHHAGIRERRHTVESERAVSLREKLWQPAYLYPDTEPLRAKAPAYERADALDWPAEFARSAAGVRAPVRIVLADHEQWWRPDADALGHLAALFTGSARVVTDIQHQSGHNISVSYAALAYHLKVLAFCEECIVARQHAETDPMEVPTHV